MISFADEEGTWLPCLGSSRSAASSARLRSRDVQTKTGERLVDRLTQLGLGERPSDLPRPRASSRLSRSPHRAGAAADHRSGQYRDRDGIVGLRRHVVRFRGRADHAGTTPMSMRSDAAFADVRLCATCALSGCEQPAARIRSGISGIVTLRPGASNVVPAEADLRWNSATSPADAIERMEDAFHAALRDADATLNVAVSSAPNARLEPVAMDAQLMRPHRRGRGRCRRKLHPHAERGRA